jgi:hypothetical protein
MAEKDKKFYWIKLRQSLLTSEKVDYLMSQKNGANYVVLYQCLCLKTINTSGELATTLGELIVPFDEQKIERECKWFDTDTIRVAMSLYKNLGLIYEQDNGILRITDFEDLVGSETYWAQRKRIQNKNFEPTEDYENIKILSHERVLLPNGKTKTVDNKRYGGNGFRALDRSKGKCEICGSEENICIHHKNGYSNELEDLMVVCRSCHRKIESGKIQIGNELESFQPTLISNIYNSNIYYNALLSYLELDCNVIYKRHQYKVNVENNLNCVGNIMAMLDEIHDRYTDDEIRERFRNASNDYPVQPKYKNCDFEWLLNNLEKFKTASVPESQGINDIDFLIAKGFSKEWVMALNEEERAEKRKKWE